MLPQMLRLVIIRRANLAGFRHIVEDSSDKSELLATKLFTFRSSEMYTGFFVAQQDLQSSASSVTRKLYILSTVWQKDSPGSILPIRN